MIYPFQRREALSYYPAGNGLEKVPLLKIIRRIYSPTAGTLKRKRTYTMVMYLNIFLKEFVFIADYFFNSGHALRLNPNTKIFKNTIPMLSWDFHLHMQDIPCTKLFKRLKQKTGIIASITYGVHLLILDEPLFWARILTSARIRIILLSLNNRYISYSSSRCHEKQTIRWELRR